MTPDQLQAAAKSIIETMLSEHPNESAMVSSLMLIELLDFSLHGDDEVAVGAFVQAINGSLAGLARQRGLTRSWKLVAVDPPR